MQMNAMIPMAGQGVDPVGSMMRGAQARQQFDSMPAQNALRDLGVQQAQTNLATSQKQLGFLDREQRMRVMEFASKMDAQSRAQEAAKIQSGLSNAIRYAQAGDWDTVNGILAQVGEPPVQGIEEFRAVAGKYKDVFDILTQVEAANAPKGPEYKVVGGQLVDLAAEGGPAPVPGIDGRQSRTVFGPDGNPVYQEGPTQTGTIPQGWEMVTDPQTGVNTMRPIAGGPAQRDASEAERKKAETARTSAIKNSVTLENIRLNRQEIENGGVPVTGIVGVAGSYVPGTPQRDFSARNDQITAASAFSELQNMRNNSPTGGAVGALTDKEREAIAASISNLQQATSADEYLRASAVLEKLMLDTAYGEGLWAKDPAGNLVFRVADPAAAARSQQGVAASDVQERIRNLPDFGSMSDQELEAWIAENG